ncbi:hypothetical protein C499_09269 [Halogeometricum borinquense DSM 11551]|uniref:Uncharacterized protein n=1 Tax=Halogeometricum borinquense (strain ATCC 700274 / DSM 11551 / JCM 10706 / KCTC 4070 / PR3) TaxID=469382 RepID=E4NN33_HALBP|nr:hypothetical protein [Halogeometricum borinquense]ADQ66263.1 hypothetical protein Hbor_06640 [Halogeometricum borinquense DSM 11551]ELY27241.1 hypothetical protein C499_09269 [Halogeometricum borinquense DSM 11551]
MNTDSVKSEWLFAVAIVALGFVFLDMPVRPFEYATCGIVFAGTLLSVFDSIREHWVFRVVVASAFLGVAGVKFGYAIWLAYSLEQHFVMTAVGLDGMFASVFLASYLGQLYRDRRERTG